MIEGQPSRSARGMALHRAAHQLLDSPLVFEDRLALSILGGDAELEIRAQAPWYRANGAIRAFTAVRSRYAEDELKSAVARGVSEVVILGAGLDTFAYRNTLPVHVYEVDGAATQAWKRVRLREAGITIPNSVVFVPVDFETQTLEEGLHDAGFRSDLPAFLSLLGVVVFLQSSTVMNIAQFVGALPRGSTLVFDYGLPASALDAAQLAEREHIARDLAAGGEPLVSFFDPQELASALRRFGFAEIEDFGYREMNARYLAGRADGLEVGRNGRRLLRARV
jgi:methyltransferase (TIGR00027 family)